MQIYVNAEEIRALIVELNDTVKEHTAEIEDHTLERSIAIKRIKRLEEHVAGLQRVDHSNGSAMGGVEDHGEESHGDADDEVGFMPTRRNRRAIPCVNCVPST
jgi:hypothetical protein